ncbi:hypothetical protein [Haladaptatus halobius]|uniref:hypothetical protein n=1 Tax=Haladaptatus halobius TaxID=2884875 RepID=UPI001D0A2569|nr:hypothetical protein [Haladaptatus halobius]
MNDDLDNRNETKYQGWSLPESLIKENDSDGNINDQTEFNGNDNDLGPPPTMREPLLRDRIRERLGVTPRQWYIIETLLIALPYPFFIAVYVSLSVNETLFLGITLVYSLFAMYVGFIS